MDATIRGQAFVVGDNVDTDQIIPAEYLSYNPAVPDERAMFGRYAMSGVPASESGLPDGNVPFADDAGGFALIVAGRNFGCGSSREHAPLALAVAGCRAVVAESYARIFYRNSINGGYVLPLETPARLVEAVRTGDEVELDAAACRLVNHTTGEAYELTPPGDAAEIIASGGIFAYARERGLLEPKT
ncbi:MAG: 3-isopropylmalate dehydratase [Phycisphaerae bacterium]|nr:3-isopropylmalate dehydratase [Phycisphaerae bacterium]